MVFLLGVGVICLLRSSSQEKAADLATAVSTRGAKPMQVLESDEAIVVNSSAKADRLFIALSPEITAGGSEPGPIAPVVESGPAAI